MEAIPRKCLITAQYKLMRELSGSLMGLSAFAVLERLEDGPMAMGEIANVLNFSTAAATGTADRCVQLGIITRGRDSEAADRRKVNLAITDKGRDWLRQLNSLFFPPVQKESESHE